MALKLATAVTSMLMALAGADAAVLFDRQAIPKNWIQTERADPNAPVNFMLAVKQQNLDKLEATFWARSSPDSPQWREWMSQEEIDAIVAPLPEHKQATMQWLHDAGVNAEDITDLNDTIEVLTTVAHAEKLFDTKMFHFVHLGNGRDVVRHMGPLSVPDQLYNVVEMVVGLSSFPAPRSLKLTDSAWAIVPQSTYAMYGVSGSANATSQAVIEFEDEYLSPSDLASFVSDTGVNIPPLAPNHIIGPQDPSQGGTEAMLDIEYIASVAPGAENWFWLEADNVWLYGFTTHFYSSKVVPNVISISYGWSEADQCEDGIGSVECQQLGVDSTGYVQRVNAQFQKIGLRGISILVASGDSGVYGRTDPSCTIPNFHPDFPAASPYVTSVGATQVNNPTTGGITNPPPVCTTEGFSCITGGTEVAVSYAVANFASGGGFSNVAARPAYQMTAVNAYFKSGVTLPPSSYYNATSRGYPDVSAFGNAVFIDNFGGQLVGGTSAATPIWAGVISLLNQYTIHKSGKTLGFLNPFLYKAYAAHPQAFTDVVSGDNICTEDGCASTCKGFYAYKGWDPVTGLGTPNVPELMKYLQSHL